MTSKEKASIFVHRTGAYTTHGLIDDIAAMLDEHAAEAIKAHEKKRWAECYRNESEKN